MSDTAILLLRIRPGSKMYKKPVLATNQIHNMNIYSINVCIFLYMSHKLDMLCKVSIEIILAYMGFDDNLD